MYVNRMRLLNVKSLHRHIPQLREGPSRAGPRASCCKGRTGAANRPFWRRFLPCGSSGRVDRVGSRVLLPPAEHLSHFLAKVDLAAIEFMDMPESSGPLWIGMGKRSDGALRGRRTRGVFRRADSGRNGLEIELPTDAIRPHPDDLLLSALSQPGRVGVVPEYRLLPTRRPDDPHGWGSAARRDHRHHPVQLDARFMTPPASLDSVLLTVKALLSRAVSRNACGWSTWPWNLARTDHGFGPRGRLVVEGQTESGVSYQHPIEDFHPVSGKCCCWSALSWPFFGRGESCSLTSRTCTFISRW